jgi:hypothetical protein
MATNRYATTEELLEAVFSVVRPVTAVTQRRVNTPLQQQKSCFLRGPCRRVINRTSLELSSVQYVRDLNLAVVKLTTIRVTKLPL